MQALEELVAQDVTVTVGVLDVDSFKELNDVYGHDTGDRALASLGQRLKVFADQAGGIAARTGGDEFAVALPRVALERGFLEFDRLRREMGAEWAASLPKVDGRGLTVSIGVASYPRDARTAADLVRRAGQALWQAKEAGRDQVALPSPDEMVLKSSYYTVAQLSRLKRLAEAKNQKESVLLREALDDLLRKYDVK
jgi:diguanylate cyclase (GGDEF)-like protein